MRGTGSLWGSFFRGLFAGIPFGIGLATGITPTKEGVSEFVATQLCSVGFGNELNCELFFFLMMVVPIGFTIWQLCTDDGYYSHDKWMGFLMYFVGGFVTTMAMYIIILG